jgi:hypothetical protein
MLKIVSFETTMAYVAKLLCLVCSMISSLSVYGERIYVNTNNGYRIFNYEISEFSERNLICYTSFDKMMATKIHITISSIGGASYLALVERKCYVQCEYTTKEENGRIVGNVTQVAFDDMFRFVVSGTSNSLDEIKQSGPPSGFIMIQMDPLTYSYMNRSATGSSFMDHMKRSLEIFTTKHKNRGNVTVRNDIYCPMLEVDIFPYYLRWNYHILYKNLEVVNCHRNRTGAYWNETQLQAARKEAKKTTKIFNSHQDRKNISKNYEDLLIKLTNTSNLHTVADSFENLIQANDSLGEQDNVGATNTVLEKLEEFLLSKELGSNGSAEEVRQTFAFRVEDLKKTSSSGIMLFDKLDEGDKLKLSSLASNASLNNVVKSNPR